MTHKYFTDQEVISLAQELIKIPSHKEVSNREKEVAEFIYSFCKSNELEVELFPVDGERKNVYAYLRGSGKGKSLMFNGHTDTIPPYNMTIDPYSAEIRDGYIWGRGGSDMKGALACMLVALLALKRSGNRLSGDIIFTGVIGEEEKSEGTEALINSGLKAEGAIVGEPTNYNYALGHRGLEWLEIKIQGKAAHSGSPQEGINAISKAAKLITRIEKDLYPKLKERFHEYMGPSVMNFGKIVGGTQPSTVADYCSLRLDRRYIPGESVASVIQEYQDIIDCIHSEDPEFVAEIVRIPDNMLTMDHLYHFTPPSEDIVKAVFSALRKNLRTEPKITTRHGWTDAALLSNYGGIPTVVTGPGDLSYAHTRDERVPIKDLIDYTQIYYDIALEFCV